MPSYSWQAPRIPTFSSIGPKYTSVSNSYSPLVVTPSPFAIPSTPNYNRVYTPASITAQQQTTAPLPDYSIKTPEPPKPDPLPTQSQVSARNELKHIEQAVTGGLPVSPLAIIGAEARLDIANRGAEYNNALMDKVLAPPGDPKKNEVVSVLGPSIAQDPTVLARTGQQKANETQQIAAIKQDLSSRAGKAAGDPRFESNVKMALGNRFLENLKITPIYTADGTGVSESIEYLDPTALYEPPKEKTATASPVDTNRKKQARTRRDPSRSPLPKVSSALTIGTTGGSGLSIAPARSVGLPT